MKRAEREASQDVLTIKVRAGAAASGTMDAAGGLTGVSALMQVFQPPPQDVPDHAATPPRTPTPGIDQAPATSAAAAGTSAGTAATAQEEKKKKGEGEEEDALGGRTVSMFRLFRFATKLDYVLLVLALIGAVTSAFAQPIWSMNVSHLESSSAQHSTANEK
jgi:hypothetical protein